MDNKTERETHDFMNVESFSQLPFIRPAPVNKEKGHIRLFGKEFGGEYSSINIGTITTTDNYQSAQTTNSPKKDNDNGESTRKFECHYCCRNFPTSQALGGHQNAHKRERQHAKRAHLQSAMVQGGLAEAHVYGLMNYHRLSSVPTPPLAYNSWSKSSSNNTYTSHISSRFYGGHGSFSQPPTINGNPLALWRIPAATHNPPTFSHDGNSVHHPLPLLAKDDLNPSQVMTSNSSSKPKMQDHHVSLDLHL
ncbi:hypothetical protein ACH5RR_002593 [Cinchona calisaya]|uniref:C2H2-type domain-containing protein n=1 Tax=Cinchona calisaya TaxID=153742 RepID=A0ABD3AT05_9GENT